MNVVHMNGVSLLPGIDYKVGRGTISFSIPPAAGVDIVYTEVINANTGATHMTRLIGDGVTYLFKLDTNFTERFELQNLFEDTFKYKDHISVRDAIEKLQVVIELVKQHDSIY